MELCDHCHSVVNRPTNGIGSVEKAWKAYVPRSANRAILPGKERDSNPRPQGARRNPSVTATDVDVIGLRRKPARALRAKPTSI